MIAGTAAANRSFGVDLSILKEGREAALSLKRGALGDEIAERLGARLVLVPIGARPSLSSPDSLGAYLTYGPRLGLTDADRNCVSNIRAGGLDVEAASSKLVWLVRKALAAGITECSSKTKVVPAVCLFRRSGEFDDDLIEQLNGLPEFVAAWGFANARGR